MIKNHAFDDNDEVNPCEQYMGFMKVVAIRVNFSFSRAGKLHMNEQTIICSNGVFLFWIAVSLCFGCSGGGEGVEGRPKGRCTALHC